MDIPEPLKNGAVVALLLQSVGKFLGNKAKPDHIVRMAEAEAKAGTIKAVGGVRAEIEAEKARVHGVSELIELYRALPEIQKRGLKRFAFEEEEKQQNIESIVAKSLPALNEGAQPENIEYDWLTNFFDKGRLVSDNDMQYLWGRVLAGEANAPGSFSKRTVNFLQSVSKHEAESFQAICRYSITDDEGGLQCLFYDDVDELYTKSGLKFEDLLNLQSIGLLGYNPIEGFSLTFDNRTVPLSYFSHNFMVTTQENSSGGFFVYTGQVVHKTPNEDYTLAGVFFVYTGQVVLTALGEEVAKLCALTPVEGFADYLVSKWRALGCTVEIVR